MHTPDLNTNETSRPFGYWLKAVDRLMAAEFAGAFEREGASRRDWRLLNVVDGTAAGDRPLNPHKLHRLADRGWVAQDGNGWTLTDDGRAAKERLGALVANIRATVTDAVSDEELTTTLATLEKIARAFGWEEGAPLPRRHGRGIGHHDHGFGRERDDRFDRDNRGDHGGRRHPRFGHGDHAGHGTPECDGRAHGERDQHGHHHPGHHRGARQAQGAYERGFDAGFVRGRDA